MKSRYLILVALTFILISCKTQGKSGSDSKETHPNSFVIVTQYGSMKGYLYEETPKHRDNFIKLVNEGFYDSLLFHRVINNFMIQGGDPESKNAPAGVQLGNGSPGYTIPAEFNPSLIHKKGALAAARMGDNMNPTKASSGSQFYIVQGTVYDSLQLVQMESRMKESQIRQAIQSYVVNPENELVKNKMNTLRQNNDKAGLIALWQEIQKKVEKQDSSLQQGFTSLQKEMYSTIGGTPHLDYAYTVFGEIYEGLDVVDSIAKVEGDRANRPLKDIVFTIEMIN